MKAALGAAAALLACASRPAAPILNYHSVGAADRSSGFDLTAAEFDEWAEDAFDFAPASLHALLQHLCPGWRLFRRLAAIVGAVASFEYCPPAWVGAR